MPRMIFVNLPVTDLSRSTAFYEAIGATPNEVFRDESSAMVSFSETIHAMLLTQERFRTFTPKAIADSKSTSEVLLCLSAEGREEVDTTVARAAGAGGRADPCPTQDHGFMYGRSFEDPDGHIWEVMWMDVAAAMSAGQKTAA